MNVDRFRAWTDSSVIRDAEAIDLAIFLLRRARPDRVAAQVPLVRHVPMPLTNSFPSGHAALTAAFAAAVGMTLPGVAAPLRTIAAVVGYSRVHTGVHYPGDVVVGTLIGATIGEGVGFLMRRQARRLQGAPKVQNAIP